MRSHPGQVAFPVAPPSPVTPTSWRPPCARPAEEVNLDPAGVEVLGMLPPLFLPPTIVVTTVVGWWGTRPRCRWATRPRSPSVLRPR